MRLLVLTNFYPPHDLGGMELRCHETVQQLRTRGHQTFVLTSRHGVAADAPAEEGVERSLYLEADLRHYRPLAFFLHRERRVRYNLGRLRRAIEAFRPDLVFAWGTWLLPQRLCYWAERWLGPERVAYAVAGYWFIEPDVHEAYWRSPARRPLTRGTLALPRALALRRLERERRLYPLALRHVSTVSAHVRERMAQAGRLPCGARVIYNGIEPQPFILAGAERKPSGRLRLVYFGGLAAHKGVHTAIEALGLLQGRGQVNDLSLALIGGGHPDYEAHLRRLAADRGLESLVRFHGRVPRGEIPRLLADYDVFLFTSIYEEPIARTVMEAMASGLAVIASPVGGQREMLADGVNALTFPPGDAAALAERIIQLRDAPALRQRLAEAGRKTVLERFTLDRMVDEIEAWLQEIVA